jgi:3,4-dihydroxy 2-butanone 4-phosphate synthase / GTP cyclohydrolase II
VPVEVLPNDANERYLRTKADRMGHEYTGEDLAVSTGVGDIAKQRVDAPRAVEKPAPRGIGMAPPPPDDRPRPSGGRARPDRSDDPVAAQAAGRHDHGKDRR